MLHFRGGRLVVLAKGGSLAVMLNAVGKQQIIVYTYLEAVFDGL